MNELVLGENPKVASFVMKKDGASRGTRLINLASLLGYLDEIARQQLSRLEQ